MTKKEYIKTLPKEMQDLYNNKEVYLTIIMFLYRQCNKRAIAVQKKVISRRFKLKGIMLSLENASLLYERRIKDGDEERDRNMEAALSHMEKRLHNDLYILDESYKKALLSKGIDGSENTLLRDLYLIAYFDKSAKGVYEGFKIFYRFLQSHPPKGVKALCEKTNFGKLAEDLARLESGFFDASIFENDRDCVNAQQILWNHLLSIRLYNESVAYETRKVVD